jgi:hypothetical protein
MGAKQPKTTTQVVQPWAKAQPYYEDLYGAAQSAFNSTDRAPYTGQLYAGPNATQLSALDMFKGAAGQATAGVDAARNMAVNTANGMYMDPATNPWLAKTVTAANQGIENQLMRQILPAIQDQSIQQGAYGGSGNGLATGLAVSDFTRQATNTANQVYGANYAAERQNQLNSPALLEQVARLSTLPAQLMDMAGSQEQGWAQAALDAELQRYNINQAAPWAGLGEFAQILNGGGFQSVGTTQPGGSFLGSALQGGAGGASIASALFPKNNLASGIGAALGAIGGGWG